MSKTQSAVVQSPDSSPHSTLPLTIDISRPLPTLPTSHHVLVRVLAVGLNPTDFKMVTHFPMPGNTIGCDLCGVVIQAGDSSPFPVGTRISGADFPYRPNNPLNGAFAEYAMVDSRHAIKVPEEWKDGRAAALGGIGWGTSVLALGDTEALGLKGTPSCPAEKKAPVVVYGGATATGIIAIQLLSKSGYAPISICSDKSAPFVMKMGAVGTASYTSTDCADKVLELANGMPIKYALDCITDAESASLCYKVLARTGARYASLEECPEAWRSRKSVKYKAVMGFEGQGYDVDLGHPVYARKANLELHTLVAKWAHEVQLLADEGHLDTQPTWEVPGRFEGVIKALNMLSKGENKGKKLVVQIDLDSKSW